MERKRRRVPKTLIILTVIIVVSLAVIIANLFIPVKYLSAYVIYKSNRNAEGEMRVTFLDVGYGDCTLIEFPDGKSALIDAGDGKYTHTLEVLRLLNSRRIKTVDYLICSSVSQTACGGLEEIIKYKNINKIYAPFALGSGIGDCYDSFVHAARECGAELVTTEYGAGESFGDGCFWAVLSPSIHALPDGDYGLAISDKTDDSLAAVSAVIWLEYSGVSFICLGDARSKTLETIYDDYSLDGNYFNFSDGRHARLEKCDVIKVAAHGAADSAYAPLYDLLSPETAIISVGGNSVGCPSAEVISDATAHAGKNLYRTDEHGTITVTVNGGGYTVEKEKQ